MWTCLCAEVCYPPFHHFPFFFMKKYTIMTRNCQGAAWHEKKAPEEFQGFRSRDEVSLTVSELPRSTSIHRSAST
jgi:hypothetical protein